MPVAEPAAPIEESQVPVPVNRSKNMMFTSNNHEIGKSYCIYESTASPPTAYQATIDPQPPPTTICSSTRALAYDTTTDFKHQQPNDQQELPTPRLPNTSSLLLAGPMHSTTTTTQSLNPKALPWLPTQPIPQGHITNNNMVPSRHLPQQHGPITPSSTITHKTTLYERDTLDELIDKAAVRFVHADSWEEYISQSRDPVSDIHHQVLDVKHPAAHLLNRLHLKGAPVMLQSAPWSQGKIHAALQRGPHKSATEYASFLREDFVGMIQKGHWSLLPANLVYRTHSGGQPYFLALFPSILCTFPHYSASICSNHASTPKLWATIHNKHAHLF